MLKTILLSFFLASGFQIVGVIFRSDCQLSLCNSLKAKSLLRKKINLQFSHNDLVSGAEASQKRSNSLSLVTEL